MNRRTANKETRFFGAQSEIKLTDEKRRRRVREREIEREAKTSKSQLALFNWRPNIATRAIFILA